MILGEVAQAQLPDSSESLNGGFSVVVRYLNEYDNMKTAMFSSRTDPVR